MVVKEGDTVKVHYTGKLTSGEVFDSSRERDPLEFTVGTGQVIPGFDRGVVGMDKGETKTVEIPSTEAYGPRHPELMMEVPKTQLPPDVSPEVGQVLYLKNPEGQVAQATIAEVKDESITLDGNHPLAGKDLVFDVELVEIA